MKKILFFLLSFLSPFAATAAPLEIGADAPDIAGLGHDGEPVNFTELYKEGTVLVFFYPKADTPGCTAQACSLRDGFADLEERGVTVVGVSTDSVEDQKKFREKYNLPYTLIADPEGKVVDAFGVPKRGAFASRQAFLIQDGKLVWRDLEASTEKQAEDVMLALKDL